MSGPLARQILAALQTRQAEVEAFIQSLVEVESPSGDMEGSRAVVDVLAQAASKVPCVDAVERVAVPDFGQHLVIRAWPKNEQLFLLVGLFVFVLLCGSLCV